MKDIKDYLHYYPKAKILICEPGVEPVSHYLEGVDWYLGKAIAERVSYDPTWIKLLLRPLSDMTEEEGMEIFWKPVKGENFSIKTGEEFRQLLIKGFDLFGLIDAGLAIDKNTVIGTKKDHCPEPHTGEVKIHEIK
jgi:hypothetical protein